MSVLQGGLELKREGKYRAYVKQIGNLLENIQLVDPSAILHATVKTEATKPIGKKEELSSNMTIFWRTPLLKRIRMPLNQKRIKTRRREDMARMSQNYLILASTPHWSSCQMWTRRLSCHE
jgi:hypothetical protein